MTWTLAAAVRPVELWIDIESGEITGTRLVNPTKRHAVYKVVSPARTMRLVSDKEGETKDDAISSRERPRVQITKEGLELPPGWGIELYVLQDGQNEKDSRV